MTSARSAIAHLRLDRPATIHDKARADDRRDEGFPRIGLLVGEDDDHLAVWVQCSGACLKRPRHAIFVDCLRLGRVALVPAASSISSPSFWWWSHFGESGSMKR